MRLTDVIVSGGGKADLWQGLNCKGKYAGELRIELTYYDSRPKPENARESVGGEADLGHSTGTGSRVKRRPLPHNPNGPAPAMDLVPEPALPGRAKHGPRDYRTPPRANSMPPEITGYPQQQPLYSGHGPMHPYGSSPPAAEAPLHPYSNAEYDEYESSQQYGEPAQPEFLPQLPPSNRQGGVPQARYGNRQAQPLPMVGRPQSHIGLMHSNSVPNVPTAYREASYDDSYLLQTDYPEPIPDVDFQHRQLRQRRSDVPPGWQEEYGDPYAQGQPYMEEENAPPPPPPMHSNSAPVVPRARPSPALRYGTTPPSARHQSVPNVSPLQSIERDYGQRTPMHGPSPQARDGYSASPEHSPYNTPPGMQPGQIPLPTSRSSAGRAMQSRHSIADPYITTPSRPHPLSQEVPRARSPLPYTELPGSSSADPQSYQHDYRERDAPPMIKPRAISPRPAQRGQQDWRPKNSYSLQFPVRSFESSDHSPLSTSQPSSRMPQGTPPADPLRKSVSPRPSPPDSGRSSIPFSPDSFDIHNPSARTSAVGNQSSPHKPYHVRPESESATGEGSRGPIVGWHGQEIDPSDHLPVDSWAPEPAKKTPTKTYGLGRERDFGPRQTATTSGGRISKDTVINVRTKSQQQVEPESPSLGPPSPTRNRLVKKNGSGRSPTVEPLREHDNYNSVPSPYEQGQQYSRGFGSPGGYDSAPNIPPKVPLQHQQQQDDVLAREIAGIDIGSSRRVPQPTAYVPVRSQRIGDRNSYY